MLCRKFAVFIFKISIVLEVIVKGEIILKKIFIFHHPLIDHKLSILRDKRTKTPQFQMLVKEITSLMTYEIMKDLVTEQTKIETPVSTMTAHRLSKCPIVLLPILRAGLGMVDGIRMFVPFAKVGHIGMIRDEKTLQPRTYYHKLPDDISGAQVFVLDPMLATGGSAVAAIDHLKAQNVSQITFICLLASPEGLTYFSTQHPDVQIYTAAIDEKLNAQGYIVPGLGDAGYRLFGTES